MIYLGKKISERISKVSKSLQQNNSEKVTNELCKEILKEKYVPPEERQKIIGDLKGI